MPVLPTRVVADLPSWVPEAVAAAGPATTDEAKLRLAIRLAVENARRGTGGPFGAAVFRETDHALVAVGVNRVQPLSNSALHAEVTALMLAESSIGSFTLRDPPHALFTSCAPCAMCLGASLWSGVRRVVYGATRDDAAALGFDEGPVFDASYAYLEARGVHVVHGVLREEARAAFDAYRAAGGAIYNG